MKLKLTWSKHEDQDIFLKLTILCLRYKHVHTSTNL